MSKNLVSYYIELNNKYKDLYDKSLVLLHNGKFYETYSITEDETLDGKIIGPDCKHLEDLTNVSMFRKGTEKTIKVNYYNPICWGFPLISEELFFLLMFLHFQSCSPRNNQTQNYKQMISHYQIHVKFYGYLQEFFYSPVL